MTDNANVNQALNDIRDKLVEASNNIDDLTETMVVDMAKEWLEGTPFENFTHIELQQLTTMFNVESTVTLAVLSHRAGLSYKSIMDQIGDVFKEFTNVYQQHFSKSMSKLKDLIELVYDTETKDIKVGPSIILNNTPEDIFRYYNETNENLGDLMHFLESVTNVIKSMTSKD